jgi:hypothetical protein
VIQGEFAVAFEFVEEPLDREVDIVHGGPARGRDPFLTSDRSAPRESIRCHHVMGLHHACP